MKTNPLSRAEQAAQKIKELARAGALGPALPGVEALAVECGVSPETMRQGLCLLEREGVVRNAGSGRGKGRVLVDAGGGRAEAGRTWRFAMLARERLEWQDPDYRMVMEKLHAEISAMGHRFFILPKTQCDLGYDLARIRRKIEKVEADAWLVESGGVELLQWFAQRNQPVIAIGGSFIWVPGLPGVGSWPQAAITAAIRRLAELGHRRIVILEEAPLRHAANNRRYIFSALEEAGITPGAYNMPDWEETADGLQDLLESLFRISPPTALLVFYPSWLCGVLSFLARRGLKVPDDVSVICGCHDPIFDWHRPRVTHLRHPDHRVQEELLRWVKAVTQGKPYARQRGFEVELVEGETIGPARKKR